MAALQLFLFFVITKIVASHQIVKTLPGFDGDLPFKLETGYIGVGDSDDVQLFYYFIESERSPEDDPLVLGSPEALVVLDFRPLCPLSFDYENSKEYSPKFLLNPYSWTKIANIIFIDAPAGTGFSYAKSWQGCIVIDTLSATQTYHFLKMKDNYFYSIYWGNDKAVQKALGIREGTIEFWVRVNESLSYTRDVSSSVQYHRNLIKKGYQVLIYRYWYRYKGKNDYYLTYATVKGAGHMAPQYKPKECLAMIDMWFAYYPPWSHLR